MPASAIFGCRHVPRRPVCRRGHVRTGDPARRHADPPSRHRAQAGHWKPRRHQWLGPKLGEQTERDPRRARLHAERILARVKRRNLSAAQGARACGALSCRPSPSGSHHAHDSRHRRRRLHRFPPASNSLAAGWRCSSSTTSATASPRPCAASRPSPAASSAFYRADIRDKAALREIFRAHAIDAVIHFAASGRSASRSRKPLMYYDNNIAGTVALAEVMAEAGSSRRCSAVGHRVWRPASVPIREDFPTGRRPTRMAAPSG